jgi:4'-phosphopantetheinyl transferase EntD
MARRLGTDVIELGRRIYVPEGDCVAPGGVADSSNARTSDGSWKPTVPCPLLAELFPQGVIGATLRQPGDPRRLMPDEKKYVLQAAAKRVHEFAAGRVCSRAALAELGISGAPLLMNDDRSPCWPSGVIGSITHTAGYCGAVVADGALWRGLGLDAEVISHVGEDLRGAICTAEEMAWIDALPADRRPVGIALAFVAKEAVYKSQYIANGGSLDFQEFTVIPGDRELESVVFTVRRSGRRERLAASAFPSSGRFKVIGPLLIAGVAWAG